MVILNSKLNFFFVIVEEIFIVIDKFDKSVMIIFYLVYFFVEMFIIEWRYKNMYM